MALTHWLRALDAVHGLAQLTGCFRRPDADPGTSLAPGAPGAGALGQIENRLAGVVVAALKEAFDRDRARMDLERAHLESERLRAEEALRAELRRQAAESAAAQVRLIAIMGIGVWMLSAALGVWLPGMRTGAARGLLAGGWVLVLATLACAFAGWQRISAWGAADRGASVPPALGPTGAEALAPWLLLGAIALSGASLLVAL